jgi:acyl dehydratase
MSQRALAQHELFKGKRDLATATVGDDLGSLQFTITAELVERTAWANDDYNPWYMQGSPFGGRIASPAAALAFDGTLFYDYYKYPEGGSLFAKQEFEFIQPLLIGHTYTMSGKLIEIYKRKGRTFYRVELSIRDATGMEVMKMFKINATPVHPTAEDGCA